MTADFGKPLKGQKIEINVDLFLHFKRFIVRPELIPVSVQPPLDHGMLVYPRVTPSIKFASTHLYTWVEIGTVIAYKSDTSSTTDCHRLKSFFL